MNKKVRKKRRGFKIQLINRNQNDLMHLKLCTVNSLTNYDSKGDDNLSITINETNSLQLICETFKQNLRFFIDIPMMEV